MQPLATGTKGAGSSSPLPMPVLVVASWTERGECCITPAGISTEPLAIGRRLIQRRNSCIACGWSGNATVDHGGNGVLRGGVA